MTRALLLLHGFTGTSSSWRGLAEVLAPDFTTLAVDLPGHGTSPLPFTDLHGDAQFVADTLARIDGPVVLVGHSYGGAVITEAATRHSKNVDHLLYLAAFALDEGEALMPFIGTLPQVQPPLSGYIRPNAEGTMSTIDPAGAKESFYADCPAGTTESAVPTTATARVAEVVQDAAARRRGHREVRRRHRLRGVQAHRRPAGLGGTARVHRLDPDHEGHQPLHCESMTDRNAFVMSGAGRNADLLGRDSPGPRYRAPHQPPIPTEELP
mgnify:CR=1 FL=1